MSAEADRADAMLQALAHRVVTFERSDADVTCMETHARLALETALVADPAGQGTVAWACLRADQLIVAARAARPSAGKAVIA